MSIMNENEASIARLKKFAEIYRDKMAEHPFMEILARYNSMSEAGLLVSERIQADLFLETHRFNELLNPAGNSPELKPV